MWRMVVLVAAWLLTFTLPSLAGKIETRTLVVDGVSRVYYFYHPRTVKGTGPLVVSFHGGGQSAKKFAASVGLVTMADTYGFILAMPQGLQNSWNTGMIYPQGYAALNNVNDLGFIDQMLNSLATSGEIDPTRIYGMGVSEGGMMAYDAACSLPGYFNAIGVVGGTLSSGTCGNSTGLSLLHIHGTADQHVPFLGGHGTYTGKGVFWASAQDGINTVAQGATCSATFTPSQLTSDTDCYISACPGTDVVEYCLVQNGGHTWPGVPPTLKQLQQSDSYSTMTFSATDLIAEFFVAH